MSRKGNIEISVGNEQNMLSKEQKPNSFKTNEFYFVFGV